jgi:hypothetical protein
MKLLQIFKENVLSGIARETTTNPQNNGPDLLSLSHST